MPTNHTTEPKDVLKPRQLEMSFEVWKPAVTFEGLYEVSNYGQVRRISLFGKPIEPRILVKDHNAFGYVTAHLYQDGKLKKRFVHRLVMEAFVGARPEGDYEINHKDGDKANNLTTNLEYITRSENKLHALYILRTIDRVHRGEQKYNAKLTEVKVRELRALYAAGVPIPKLADQYEVTHACINSAVKGKSWKHIK